MCNAECVIRRVSPGTKSQKKPKTTTTKKTPCFHYLHFAKHVDSERKSSDNLFVVLPSSRVYQIILIEKNLLCYAGIFPVIVHARAKKPLFPVTQRSTEFYC